MICAEYRRLGPVPALGFWFDDPTSAKRIPWTTESPLLAQFLTARFGGRPLWVCADPDRDGFLTFDIEIIVDAKRDTATTSIGRTEAATPAYLSEFVDQTGFSWDAWFLLSGQHELAALPTIIKQWYSSQDSNHSVGSKRFNNVPAEAFYTYGDGSCLVWVPSIPLDEAVRLINPNGDVLEVE